MRALVLNENGPAVLEQPLRRRHGEAVISLRVGGVCATDLELVMGYMGFRGVLGHEFVGRVEASPDPAWLGRRVVGEINASCGRCATCRAGRRNHCPNRTVLGIKDRDGAFAEHLCLPVSNLHVVPDNVSDDAAVFVEPLAAACRIVQQVHVRPSDRVTVLGLGRLGQLCARVLSLSGAAVLGVSRTAEKRALLPAGIPSGSPDDARRGDAADIVVDCTGSSDGLALSRELVRPRGTIVLKSTVHDVGDADPTGWVVDELTLVGSRCGPFAPALRLLATRLVDPTPLISARRSLADGVDALALASEAGVLKVLVEP